MDMDLTTFLRNKLHTLFIISVLASTFANAAPTIDTSVPEIKRTPPPREEFHTVEVDGERVLQGGFFSNDATVSAPDSGQGDANDNPEQCLNPQGCNPAQPTEVLPPEPAPVVATIPTDNLDNCALDNDQDGVNNCEDSCQNTLPNLAVTRAGCLNNTQLPQVSTLAFKFDINDWAMKPEFQTAITQLGMFLDQHPEVEATLYGHAEWLTDQAPEPSFSYWLTYWRTNNIINQLNRTGMIKNSQLKATEYTDFIPMEISTLLHGALQNQQIHVYIQPRRQN